MKGNQLENGICPYMGKGAWESEHWGPALKSGVARGSPQPEGLEWGLLPWLTDSSMAPTVCSALFDKGGQHKDRCHVDSLKPFKFL